MKTNRTWENPYEIHIEIHYLNKEFQMRIQNLVEKYRPAFEIKSKNFIVKHLQKDKVKIKLVSYKNKAYKAVMTGNDSGLYNLNYFNFQSGHFSFSERNEAEEAMYKIEEIIKETLNKEALLFQQIF
ncbi:hypothetical protein CG477_022955 (plasmid) [Bacillus cytotoxicus]|nr:MULTISPECIES: hypothetical protein [Bacillus cereus group]AWC31048.1 hypothetical protein CG483_022715 [Bacillus cytotoxicus]AWC35090.1 hypothetical protein CG482_022430 [Bacillus cytotoxicus]AWC39103.1 hypothetical protein CG481_022430 [Bacillus cytotoxicus]AWC47033.1 hypothetical protein CG479_021380 [Bacillus cytotoxicus]AWC55185.1 hypothetical protein CG477_022955 [Bacillus cytotoxicus]